VWSACRVSYRSKSCHAGQEAWRRLLTQTGHGFHDLITSLTSASTEHQTREQSASGVQV
jgi:hypothetical protein